MTPNVMLRRAASAKIVERDIFIPPERTTSRAHYRWRSTNDAVTPDPTAPVVIDSHALVAVIVVVSPREKGPTYNDGLIAVAITRAVVAATVVATTVVAATVVATIVVATI